MTTFVSMVGLAGVALCLTQLGLRRRYNLMPAIIGSIVFTLLVGCFFYVIEQIIHWESIGGIDPEERRLQMAGQHGAESLVIALVAAIAMTLLGTVAHYARTRSIARLDEEASG